ncbi:transcription factor DIVARICATA-like [Actinidia eriantha]|uniref:transcription factor DIVARICATA-like n=1 Tax=Actinidia eriantha TaxID=165200 RepID=UPI00258F1CCC|nr:transcription factor DIVARICATA-like [Actinidia eriantha]
MRWEMEIMLPAYSDWLIEECSADWLLEESRSTQWTAVENKKFEDALAVYDKDTPDRWQKVAAMIPGKTVGDVRRQYKELEEDVSSIEAGLVPIPGYNSNPLTLEWGNDHGFDRFKPSYGPGGKRPSSGRALEQERKKGVPWTEEEHKLFLMGLKKYGKGDWRNISRNFVITRTPTQVASHAQKYFIRQLSGGKDKRRSSIHDITTVNLNDNHQTLSPDSKRPPSPDQSFVIPHQRNPVSIPRTQFQWNLQSGGAEMAVHHQAHGNTFMSPNEIHSYGPPNMGFQVQSMHHYPHG